MKVLFPFVICPLSLCYQTAAEEIVPEKFSLEVASPKKVEDFVTDAKPSERCWPLRMVGIAETAKDYYASCKQPSSHSQEGEVNR